MKTFASLSIACAAAMAAGTSATPCDMSSIQGKLLPNATAGLKNCASTTGFDIWAIAGFPTADQAQKIMKTRDCVDFLNQINERANQDIQCDVEISGVEKDFGMFLVSLLTGKTGNETVASSSGSNDVGSPDGSDEDDSNGTVAPLLDSSDDGSSFSSTKSKKLTSTKTDAPTSAPVSSASVPMSAVLCAGLLAAVGLALQL